MNQNPFWPDPRSSQQHPSALPSGSRWDPDQFGGSSVRNRMKPTSLGSAPGPDMFDNFDVSKLSASDFMHPQRNPELQRMIQRSNVMNQGEEEAFDPALLGLDPRDLDIKPPNDLEELDLLDPAVDFNDHMTQQSLYNKNPSNPFAPQASSQKRRAPQQNAYFEGQRSPHEGNSRNPFYNSETTSRLESLRNNPSLMVPPGSTNNPERFQQSKLVNKQRAIVNAIDKACAPIIDRFSRCMENNHPSACNTDRIEIIVCAAQRVCPAHYRAFELCSSSVGRNKAMTGQNCPQETGKMFNCVHDRYLSVKELMKRRELLENLELQRKEKEREGYLQWKQQEDSMMRQRRQWQLEQSELSPAERMRRRG